jgi:hypothetical protein
MKLSAIAIAAATCFAALAPSVANADDTVVTPKNQASPQGFREHSAKIREQISINENRAHELEPIIARDRQARHDVEVDWAALERHAREMRASAADFRGWAADLGGRARDDANTFANELEQFAQHDEENARGKHEIADRLDRNIQGESAARDWHLKRAAWLRDWLASNGG